MRTPEPPQVDETPGGFKLILSSSGTIHSWTMGDLKTLCGHKIDNMELVNHDGTQSAKKTCAACEKRFAKIGHLIR